jgi:hypothetical protein
MLATARSPNSLVFDAAVSPVVQSREPSLNWTATYTVLFSGPPEAKPKLATLN